MSVSGLAVGFASRQLSLHRLPDKLGYVAVLMVSAFSKNAVYSRAYRGIEADRRAKGFGFEVSRIV